MEDGEQSREKLGEFKSEKGYLMLSTLFLLVLTSLLLQSVIKISTNHIIQLNQVSSAYQARTALNMSEKILETYIVDNDYELPGEIEISSSVGNIKIIKKINSEYEAVITQKNGTQFAKEIVIEMPGNDDEETEDSTELLNKECLRPNQEENIISD